MLAGRAKVRAEGACRACARPNTVVFLEPAHIIARAQVPVGMGAEDPLNFCPLCEACHRRYDLRLLDLAPHLRPDELAYACALVGEAAALRRITGDRDATTFDRPWSPF